MKRLFALSLLAVITACNSNTPVGCGSVCDAGTVCIDNACASLCNSDAECGDGQICSTRFVCETGRRTTIPVITGVDGNGTVDGEAGYGAHRIANGLIIEGEHLTGASVFLDTVELLVDESSPNRLTVTLPDDLAQGSYALMVSNAIGAAQVQATVLRGEQGSQGEKGDTGDIGTQGVQGPEGPQGVPGPIGSIDILTDVDTSTTAPVVGSSLRWNGTSWVPGPDVDTTWPAGSYCILRSGGSCPAGFSQQNGHVRAIPGYSAQNTMYYSNTNVGDSYLGGHGGISNPFQYGALADVILTACCK